MSGRPGARPPAAALAAFHAAGEADVWTTLARWRDAGRRCVLLTVVESRGFTPRKPGSHLLLAEDGACAGTIGGGAIEHAMLAEARALLAAAGTPVRTVRKGLTTELGMCCGGEMVVHLEVLEALPRLFVYGAGHLARPIAALASGVGFAVTVVDARPEWASTDRFPTAAVRCEEPESHARALATLPGDSIVIVTHDHALDQRLVQTLLARPLRFLGMVGSLAKRGRFRTRLRARGFDDAALARLRTPVGLAIGAQTPEEIAVSVLAELIAVRRGANPERGWEPRPRTPDETARPESAAAAVHTEGVA
jgi:xanthine dehydrogenase accessory factor